MAYLPNAPATPADGSVTNAKLADMATGTIKGRAAAGTGAPSDLTAAEARALIGAPTQGQSYAVARGFFIQ